MRLRMLAVALIALLIVACTGQKAEDQTKPPPDVKEAEMQDSTRLDPAVPSDSPDSTKTKKRFSY